VLWNNLLWELTEEVRDNWRLVYLSNWPVRYPAIANENSKNKIKLDGSRSTKMCTH
jgi:hypothetical protein